MNHISGGQQHAFNFHLIFFKFYPYFPLASSMKATSIFHLVLKLLSTYEDFLNVFSSLLQNRFSLLR